MLTVLELFPSVFFTFFFCESPGKGICVGRLFTRSMYLPFFLIVLFSLHPLRLSKETL